MFVTLKGCWLRVNVFITEDNKRILVYPYGITGDIVRPLLPFKCYILLQDGIVKDYIKY